MGGSRCKGDGTSARSGARLPLISLASLKCPAVLSHSEVKMSLSGFICDMSKVKGINQDHIEVKGFNPESQRAFVSQN